MIKIKNYINFLNENNNIDKKLDKVFDECKPYIDMVKSCKFNRLLYRGFSETDIKIEKINHNWYRTPKDTPQEFHDFINEILYDKFGWLGRNGVFSFFMNISKTQNSYFNKETYILFPIGNFDYLWNPKIHDLYSDYELEFEGFYVPINVIENEWDNNKYGADKYSVFEDFYNMRMVYYKELFYEKLENFSNEYIDYDICKSKKTNEIIINCDSYYLVNMKYTDKILKRIS